MVLGACGAKTTTVTSTTSTTSTTTTILEPIVWKAATTTPAMSPPGTALTTLGEKIAEETGGRLTFQIYYTSSLFEAKEALRSMESGVGQISDFWPSAMPGIFPLNEVFSLPGLGWPDLYTSTEILNEVWNNSPALRAEYGDLIMYGAAAVNPPTIIHSSTKLLRTMEDLEGYLILGSNQATAEFFEALGATAVFIPYEDTYLSWDKGIIEGAASTFGWMQGAGVMDIATYHTVMGTTLIGGKQDLVINRDAWNALPTDIQQIITDLEAWYKEFRTTMEVEADQKGIAYCEENGHEFYELPPAELERWLAAAKPIHEAWIAGKEAQGIQGAREVYDLLVATIEKYK